MSNKFIVHNKTSIKQVRESAEGAYRKWVASKGGREPKFANPDILEDSDDNKIWGVGVSPELAQLILERYADERGYFAKLSVKQNEVLQLILIGYTTKLISKQLKINKSTTTTYINRIKKHMLLLIKTLT